MEVMQSVTSISADGDYPLCVVTILSGCLIIFWWNCPSVELGWSIQKRLVTNYTGQSPPREGGQQLQTHHVNVNFLVA